MRFSNKAYKYLEKLRRNSDYVVSDQQRVIDYLRGQKIQAYEKIVEFQVEYSGLELTITNKPGSGFSACLFSKADIKENKPIEEIETGGKLFFYCGDHKTAQFYFFISSDGEICTYNNDDDTANIISSSFDKFIETYAFEDLLSQNKTYEHPYFYDLRDHVAFKEITSNYFLHGTASDACTSWLSDRNSNLIIRKGTWFDRPASYVHIYGANQKECENFIDLLKNEKIIA